MTPEQINRLREKSGCSEEKVKEALTQGDGSLLEGLLYLEKQGHVRVPPEEGYYSTKLYHNLKTHPTFTTDINYSLQKELKEEGLESVQTASSVVKQCREELFENQLEIWYQNQRLGQIPVVCFLLLMPLSYGSVFPLLICPLFFGVYYQFSRKESFLGEFNSVLRRLAKNFRYFSHGILAKVRSPKGK